MLKKISIALLFLLYIFADTFAHAHKVVAVQSASFSPYEQNLKGFRSVCRDDITSIIISELTNADVIEKINGIRPDLIIAIGIDALVKVKNIRDIPVIYSMVLNPGLMLSGEKNIMGVIMHISPEQQIRVFSRALPEIKNIGLIYDPSSTGNLVKRIKEVAPETGIDVVAKEVRKPADAPTRVKGLKGKVDALWMLPDTTVITQETVEYMLLFSIENKIPVLTFSEKYLESGALMSVSADPYEMGRRAGELADLVLSGKQNGDAGQTYVREKTISVNMKAAKKLGIKIDKEILKNARILR